MFDRNDLLHLTQVVGRMLRTSQKLIDHRLKNAELFKRRVETDVTVGKYLSEKTFLTANKKNSSPCNYQKAFYAGPTPTISIIIAVPQIKSRNH